MAEPPKDLTTRPQPTANRAVSTDGQPRSVANPNLGARIPGLGGPQPQMKARNAAVVYGGGGMLLYGLSFYNLAGAEWFNGLMLLIPATCLAYLAYRYSTQSE